MELSQQEIELFLPLPGLIQNFFNLLDAILLSHLLLALLFFVELLPELLDLAPFIFADVGG